VEAPGRPAGEQGTAVIEVVFLDAGETILHPHPSWPELFATTCRRHGVEVSPEKVGPILYGMLRSWSDVAEQAGARNPSFSDEESHRFWTFVYKRCLDELGVQYNSLPDELYKVFTDTATYRLYDDALPAIEQLRAAGYRIGLISNYEGWLEELLVELEVGDVFDVSVISGLVGLEKPDVRIYELAIESAGVSPSSAVHVGDSVVLDVEPARAAGMEAILLDRAGDHTGHTGPRVRTLAELPDLVAAL
jgi:putative hydrolase of the HAD superfamily